MRLATRRTNASEPCVPACESCVVIITSVLSHPRACVVAVVDEPAGEASYLIATARLAPSLWLAAFFTLRQERGSHIPAGSISTLSSHPPPTSEQTTKPVATAAARAPSLAANIAIAIARAHRTAAGTGQSSFAPARPNAAARPKSTALLALLCLLHLTQLQLQLQQLQAPTPSSQSWQHTSDQLLPTPATTASNRRVARSSDCQARLQQLDPCANSVSSSDDPQTELCCTACTAAWQALRCQHASSCRPDVDLLLLRHRRQQ